jgi:hypothetical protein
MATWGSPRKVADAATGDGSGDNTSNYMALSTFNSQATAGDTAHLSTDTYTTGIAPATSGTSGNRITYVADSGATPDINFGTDISGLTWNSETDTGSTGEIYSTTGYGSSVDNPSGLVAGDSGWTTYPDDNWLAAPNTNYNATKDVHPYWTNFPGDPDNGIARLWNRNYRSDNSRYLAATDALDTSGDYDQDGLGARSSFLYDNSKLNVRMPDGTSPSTQTLMAWSKGSGNSGTALHLKGKAYITVDGITISYVHRVANVANADHITIQNCTVNHSTLGISVDTDNDTATYIVIKDNTLDGVGDVVHHTYDTIALSNPDHCLVIGNTITHAAHYGVTLKDPNRCVIKDNTMNGIFGGGTAVRHTWWNTNKAHNFIEGNTFYDAFIADEIKAFHWGDHPAIRMSSSYSVARLNQVWDVGLPFETSNVFTENRSYYDQWYHNTCWSSGPVKAGVCGGFNLTQVRSTPWDRFDPVANKVQNIRIINNLFGEAKNGYQYSTDEWTCFRNRGGLDASIYAEAEPTISNNVMWSSTDTNQLINSDTVANVESTYGTYFSGNIITDPNITSYSPTGPDFTPTSGSSCDAAGAHLTTTNGAYTGNTIVVNDLTPFRSSFGIKDTDDSTDLLAGDSIKVGSNSAVTITDVDYTTNTITHDGSISGGNAEAVNLDIMMSAGKSAPDVGAIALNSSQVVYIAASDTATLTEDDPLTDIDVLANDTNLTQVDSVSYTSGNGATVQVKGDNSAAQYQPAASFTGTDSFSYTASDGSGNSDTTTVIVTVNPSSTVSEGGEIVDNSDAGYSDNGDWSTDTTLTGEYGSNYRVVGQAS